MAPRPIFGLACVALLAASPASAAGFEVSGQSAKALGLAGAFVAQADDPSASFFNPGGLALLKKKKAAAAGLAATAFNEALYQGLPPGIGTGTTGEQETAVGLLPHVFLTLPVGKRLVAGVGLYTPFRLQTDWSDPASFAGRFLATSAQIDTLDLTQTLGVAVTPKLGFGVGVILRTSKLQASRRISVDLGGPLDVAVLSMETDFEPAVGWSLGVLHKPSPRFSWGLSLRSAITTEYVGTGKAVQLSTGDVQLDRVIAATLPFEQDLALSSEVSFPATASLGVAWSPSRSWLLEVDFTQTGWSELQQVDFRFATSRTFDSRYSLALEDSSSWRAGVRYRFPTGLEVRGGYAFEESPQPDTTVGAFLADSNRNTVSAGVGLDWLDVGVTWTTYDQRITATSAVGLNGHYRANVWMVAVTANK